MLVIVSDVHLTDGTSGHTIDPGAFKVFVDLLTPLVAKAGAKNLEIVFLGDILDVIRSATWLSTSIRPWSAETDVGGHDERLKDVTSKIARAICGRPQNVECMRYLSDLKAALEPEVLVTFTYVTGNHDWLINRYPETREVAARFLHLDPAASASRFPLELTREDHGVTARHGDVYDPFNFDGNRDASSLGDAIVIDLLNRFPLEVASRLGLSPGDPFIDTMRQIDNVRPLLDVPLWVGTACDHMENPKVAAAVQEAWNTLARQFLALAFVQKHDRPWALDPVDVLEAILPISGRTRMKVLAAMLDSSWVRGFLAASDNLDEKAATEPDFVNGKADFVVYGHTHEFGIWPIGKLVDPQKTLRQSYINSGTWRMVYQRGKKALFSGWDVLTFLCFFREDERRERFFEVWNGALA